MWHVITCLSSLEYTHPASSPYRSKWRKPQVLTSDIILLRIDWLPKSGHGTPPKGFNLWQMVAFIVHDSLNGIWLLQQIHNHGIYNINKAHMCLLNLLIIYIINHEHIKYMFMALKLKLYLICLIHKYVNMTTNCCNRLTCNITKHHHHVWGCALPLVDFLTDWENGSYHNTPKKRKC